MKNTAFILFILIVLIIGVAIISNTEGLDTAVWILILSGLKFLGISFFFMDLRKAHMFWKVITLVFLILFILIVWIIK